MGRIEGVFDDLKAAGHKGFIPYVTAGDPSLEVTADLVCALEDAGSDVIELGVPFSDPLADGPTIQAAGQRALANGTTLEGIFKMIEDLRKRTSVPIIVFTYYNPVHRFGIEAFVERCASIGADGALVTDLPPEESGAYRERMQTAGLDTVFLIAPTSRDARIKAIVNVSTGFVYYVSRAGVTGEQASLEASLVPMTKKIRSQTDKPLAVGFGISTPEQASQVAEHADAIVVGSAIVRRVGELGGSSDLVSQIGGFAADLTRPLKENA